MLSSGRRSERKHKAYESWSRLGRFKRRISHHPARALWGGTTLAVTWRYKLLCYVSRSLAATRLIKISHLSRARLGWQLSSCSPRYECKQNRVSSMFINLLSSDILWCCFDERVVLHIFRLQLSVIKWMNHVLARKTRTRKQRES